MSSFTTRTEPDRYGGTAPCRHPAHTLPHLLPTRDQHRQDQADARQDKVCLTLGLYAEYIFQRKRAIRSLHIGPIYNSVLVLKR
jgi:hypothetical protein